MTGKALGTMIQDGTVTATQLGTNSVGADEIAADAVGASEIAADAVGASEIAAGAVGSSEIADASITMDDLAPSARGVFTKSYTSSDQTITFAGTLSLTHGLGEVPKLIRITLKNQTAEANYSPGDEVELTHAYDSTANRGVVVIGGPTDIFIRFGNAAGVFTVLNKSTGVTSGITAANWRFVVRAWA